MTPFSRATVADFRVRSRGFSVRDVLFNTLESSTALRTTGRSVAVDDHVRLWIVRRGEWRLGLRNGAEQVVRGGRFTVQAGRLSHFAAAPGSVGQVLVVPSSALGAMTRGQPADGPADTAEVRLLTAHATLVQRTVAGLGPAGIDAARETLVELARAACLGGLDETEPRLGAALADAARRLADRRLTDPDLTPMTLAGELNVSVRTLQRAFAAEGRSASAYIRDQRLEQVHRALASPGRRLALSTIAARWRFADHAHLTRAFRQRFGYTPSDYAASFGAPSTPAVDDLGKTGSRPDH
ncbi:helix-turn-helix domain-containing protein [Catenuloplanes sp. NPDC020197]|uniref:helix-turn-helix domain-containing protein n=1 Tax=Catenuloplanes sp. NPDC020197 TaxID=3363958 RepID=UPI0037A98915